MAAIIVNQGLQRIGINLSQASGYSASRYVQTMAVDDSSNAFAAGHTALNSGGAITNAFDKALNTTPTISGQTVTHVCTYSTTEANFTIRRISLHDNAAASVTTSSTTLIGGIDGQALTKTTDFSLEITITIEYTDNS